MDPLSITCAAITLATALKDLIELGVKLNEFCNRVSKNDKELAHLCTQISSDLQELENVYLSNPEAMDHSPPLRDAVDKLVLKINIILGQFVFLLKAQPKNGSTVLNNLRSAFKAPDVEDQIRALKEDISHCYKVFQRLAIARIDTRVEGTHAIVQKLLALSMEQRKEVQVMKSNVQQQLHVHDSSMAMSSTETTIRKTSQSRTLDCLEKQLNNVGIEVSKCTAVGFDNFRKRPVKPFACHFNVLSYHIPPAKRHRTLLRQVLNLLSDLEEDATAIDNHASTLCTLGNLFWCLEMLNEATVVFTWAISLYRVLMNLQPNGFAPYLADSILSRECTAPVDTGAYDEAIKILHPLIGPSSSPDVRCQFAYQLARRIECVEANGSRDDSLEDAKYALDILEPILRAEAKFVDVFTLLDDDDNLINHLASLLANRTQWEIDAQTKPVGFSASDFEVGGAYSFLIIYAFTLRWAFKAHYDLDDADAERFILKAAITRAYIAAIYPDTNMEVILAYYLALFPDDISPPERKLQYLDKSVKIYRKAVSFDPIFYTNAMLDALSEKADWLQRTRRQEEADQTWREVLKVTPIAFAQAEESIVVYVQSVETYHRTFNTYSEAQARACQALVASYQLAGHNKHAFRLADLAVQQLQPLALEDPSSYTDNLASSLVSWINLFPSPTSRNNRIAIEKVKAILDQYDDLIRGDISIFHHHGSLTSALIDGVDDHSIAQSLSLDVAKRLRRLMAQLHPETETIGIGLLSWQQAHGTLLARCDLLVDATTWLKNLRDKYRHLARGDENFSSWYTYMLLHLPMVLKDEGDLEGARATLRTMLESGGQLANNAAWWCSLALIYQAEIAGCLGEDALAVELSTECIWSAQLKPMLWIIQHSVAVLPLYSRQLAINERYEEALSVMEGLASRAKEEMTNPSRYDQYRFIWPSEYLRTWAACLADAHKMSESLAVAKQAAEEARRVKGATTASLRNMSESFYGTALWTLGCILLLSNDRYGALVVFEEAKELWKQRSKVRKFDLRNLGLVLWALGKVYCLLGRHEDGATANQDLEKVLKSLTFLNPTMHLVVSVAIDQERRRPAWATFMGSVAEELRCGHVEEMVPRMKAN